MLVLHASYTQAAYSSCCNHPDEESWCHSALWVKLLINQVCLPCRVPTRPTATAVHAALE